LIPENTPATPAELSLPALIAAGKPLPRELGRPLRVGAVNNPQSGQNLKTGKLASVLDVLSGHPEVVQHGGETLEGLRGAAIELRQDGVEVIAVNGGDGTVQAVLTGLFAEPQSGPAPLLLVLPGGTTNMVALDIGVPKELPAVTLERFLRAAKQGQLPAEVVQRAVIRMQRAGFDPIFGMFFGAGAIYHGINFCRRFLYRVGLKGEIGPGVALGVLILQAALGKRDTLIPPLNASGRIDGVPFERKEYHAVMASTLDHLFLGIRPFWGKGEGPLKYSAFATSLRHPWRAAPSILRGRANDYVRAENGYEGYTAREIELHIDSGFTLDGELFEPNPDLPVVLNGGYTASFLRLNPR
jgi:hypothetical protein